MRYEVLIKDHTYEEVTAFYNKERSYVLFKDAQGEYKNVLFLLAHGAPDGRMAMDGHLLNNEQVLRLLIKHGICGHGITDVYTIACYGGMQDTVEINGITISSLHDSPHIINVSLATIMGDIRCLGVHI